MFRRPRAPQLEITCPFCMTLTKSTEQIVDCPKCSIEIPVLYRNEAYGTQIRPFFLQVGGWTQSGKTVYLSALLLMLKKMPRLWNGFFPMASNRETQQRMKEVETFMKTGILPEPTPLGPQEAFILMLSGLPSWTKRALIVRDASGESFSDMDFAVANMPYFLHVPTTLMFFSLEDMDTEGRSMTDMLTNYVHTLLKHGIDPRNSQRNLVVVISKADKIRGLPPHLRDYLVNDRLWDDVNTADAVPPQLDQTRMQGYMRALGNVSNAINDWLLTRDADAAAFAAMANTYNIQLRYTLVSSLGAEKTSDIAVSSLSPRRVLDPFLWAMEFDKN